MVFTQSSTLISYTPEYNNAFTSRYNLQQAGGQRVLTIGLLVTSTLQYVNHRFLNSGEPMLDGTLIVIVSDHGGWRKTHNAAGGGFQPFAALVDIPILIRGESTVIYLA